MANMMAGVIMQGSADSGYGITLEGFHCPTSEYGARMAEIQKKVTESRITDIYCYEDNGYATALVLRKEQGLPVPQKSKIATFRREPHKFFQDLPAFFKTTKAQFIDRMTLTGSLGSISLTVLYRPIDEPGG